MISLADKKTIQIIFKKYNAKQILLYLVISLLLPFNTKVIAAPPASSTSTLSFANHLFDTGDYYRAITEYQRFLFLFPKSDKTELANLKIALSYLEGKKYDIAFDSLDKIASRKNNQYAQTARLRLAGGLYEEKQYNNAIAVISPLKCMPDNKDAREVFLGLCQLHNSNLQQAKSHFSTIKQNSLLSKELHNICNEYENITYKNKWVAGTFSAILPGSGQLYVKRPHDAAWAFLLNSIFLSAAYYAFDNDEVIAGIFAASLEAVWYTGNIYNAANGAKKYNQYQDNVFFKDLDEKTIYNQENHIYKLFFRIPM
jgi:predicted negative regulator of RcsB-dependent stress response